MDSIDFTEFSTSGVNNSDTFDIWRKKTNGIVDKLNSINESISAVPVTLNTNQTLTGAKTFSEGTAEFPVLKIGLAGLFSEYNELISTVPFKSSKIIAQEQLQLGNYSLAVPVDNPSANSLLGKSGETLTWTTLSSIISQVRSEGAAAAFTTNIVLPVGTVHAYSSAIAPVGWYICNGTRFKGSVAPELAAVLLDTYGSIYSTETGGTPVSAAPVYNAELYYTLPDLRGRALVGMGYGFDGTADQRLFNLGETGGKFAHTLLVSEMPAHSHITAAGGAHTHKFNLDTTGNYNSILAFGRNDINSEIGIFDESECSYKKVVNDPGLNFNRANLITGTYRKRYDCERLVYWDDGINPTRVMDIDNPPYMFVPERVGDSVSRHYKLVSGACGDGTGTTVVSYKDTHGALKVVRVPANEVYQFATWDKASVSVKQETCKPLPCYTTTESQK